MSSWTLSTQIVGSYHKPDWLIRADRIGASPAEFFRPEADTLRSAQDDAVRLAVADQERAGLDLVTDGEQRRQSFVRYFDRLDGIDSAAQVIRPRKTFDYVESQGETPATQRHPRVTGPIRWREPMVVDDLRFLKSVTRRGTKMTVVGPITLAARLVDEHYGDFHRLVMDIAAALNQELLALDREGVDLIQLDEPEFHFSPDITERFGVEAVNRAVRGVRTRTAIHVCYGYAKFVGRKSPDPGYGRVLELLAATDADEMAIEYAQPGHTPDVLTHCGEKAVILGVLNLASEDVESVDTICGIGRAAMEVIPPQRLRLAPDCGMWFLPRSVAWGKIRAMGMAAELLRAERGL